MYLCAIPCAKIKKNLVKRSRFSELRRNCSEVLKGALTWQSISEIVDVVFSCIHLSSECQQQYLKQV